MSTTSIEVPKPEPRKLPGVPTRNLCPVEFFHATQIPNVQTDHLIAEDFGLVEVEVGAVHTYGIEVMGERFSAPELERLVTRPNVPSRNFVAQFDYCDLARGALDRIRLVEIDDHGRRTFLFECRNVHCEEAQPSGADVRQAQRKAERRTAMMRNNSQLEVLAIQRGNQARAEMEKAQKARARRQKAARHEPVVATPQLTKSHRPASLVKDGPLSVTSSNPTAGDAWDDQPEGSSDKDGVGGILDLDTGFEED